MSEEGSAGPSRSAVVLDYLAHGRPDDDRPQYQKPPLAHALDTADFSLYELVLGADEAVSIGDDVAIDPPDERIEEISEVEHDDLSGGARSEIEHVVREIVDRDEDRFVEFFNEAGPITLRLHQFNLLPGIGDKLRDNILDAREREPFESLDDLEARVSGLHDPAEVLVERVTEEVRDEDVKYKLFARRDDPGGE